MLPVDPEYLRLGQAVSSDDYERMSTMRIKFAYLLAMLMALPMMGFSADEVHRGRQTVIKRFHMGPARDRYIADNDADDNDGWTIEGEEADDACHLDDHDGCAAGCGDCDRRAMIEYYGSPTFVRWARHCRDCPLYDDLDIIDEYDAVATWPGKNESSWMHELVR